MLTDCFVREIQVDAVEFVDLATCGDQLLSALLITLFGSSFLAPRYFSFLWHAADLRGCCSRRFRHEFRVGLVVGLDIFVQLLSRFVARVHLVVSVATRSTDANQVFLVDFVSNFG